MGDNQNRGPGDNFRRGQGGRKRREPPVIDGTATPVPVEADPFDEPDEPRPAPAESSDIEAPMSAAPAEHPVGSPEHPTGAAAPEPSMIAEPVPSAPVGEPGPHSVADAPAEEPRSDEGPRVEPPAEEPSAPISFASGLHDDASPETVAPDTAAPDVEEARQHPAAEPQPSAAAYVAPAMASRERAEAPRRGSILPALLGVVIALLLAALLGLLYAGPQLTGSADLSARVDALTQRVATLEARPQAAPATEPAQPPADIGAIEARSKALEGEAGDLKTALADLASKLDAVTQQAAANGAKIATLEQSAAGSAQSPAAAPPPAAPAAGTETAPGATPAAPAPSEQASPPAPAPAGPDVAALSGKLDDLAKRVAALPTDVPAPVDLGPLQSRLADLSQRVDALQAGVAALPKVDPQAIDAKIAGIAGKTAETDQRVAAAAATLAALPKIDLSPLEASVAEVDKRLAPIEAALSVPKAGDRVSEARAEGSADETRAAPLAVVAGAVSRALDEGRPFGPELDALHGLGLDDTALGPLPALAASGAPTPHDLEQQWAARETDVLTASVPKTGESVIDRFAAGARNLVQVRRVGTASGDDPAAVSARIRAALERGDLAGAIADWEKLPPASQAASQAWADAVRGRLGAEAEARSLLARAVSVLAKAKG